MTILFIEDHEFIVEYAREQLLVDHPGCRVVGLATGGAALGYAREHAVDIVILDLSLPDADGFDLIAPLRAGGRQTKIIIFTARDDEATRVRALALPGFSGLLWKGSDYAGEISAAVGVARAGGRYITKKFWREGDPPRPAPSSPQALGGDAGLAEPVVAPARLPSPFHRIVVVKWDRLRAEAVARAARIAFPEAEIVLCHAAGTAETLLRAGPAALGLIGLTLPDRDGLDFLAEAVGARWFRRIMVVSGRQDERARQCLRALRVHGFFDPVHDAPGELPGAIRRVGEGGGFFSPEPPSVALAPSRIAPTLAQLLTDIELQVFAVIGGGLDDLRASVRLDMAPATVHSHRKRIMGKLGVHSAAELITEAIRRGMVRFSAAGAVLTPGLERALAARAARSRDPFGKKDGPQG